MGRGGWWWWRGERWIQRLIPIPCHHLHRPFFDHVCAAHRLRPPHPPPHHPGGRCPGRRRGSRWPGITAGTRSRPQPRSSQQRGGAAEAMVSEESDELGLVVGCALYDAEVTGSNPKCGFFLPARCDVKLNRGLWRRLPEAGHACVRSRVPCHNIALGFTGQDTVHWTCGNELWLKAVVPPV